MVLAEGEDTGQATRARLPPPHAKGSAPQAPRGDHSFSGAAAFTHAWGTLVPLPPPRTCPEVPRRVSPIQR